MTRSHLGHCRHRVPRSRSTHAMTLSLANSPYIDVVPRGPLNALALHTHFLSTHYGGCRARFVPNKRDPRGLRRRPR